MAKRRRTSVQEALEAATAGVPVRDAGDEKPAVAADALDLPVEEPKPRGKSVTDGRSKTTIEEKKSTRRPVKSPPATRARKKKGSGHQKTSTGYMKSTGQEIVRLTLHLTPDQKRNLKIKSLKAGFENTSAYLVEALNL